MKRISMTALILVVDDSAIQRKIYAAALKAAGYDVIVAENGREGVDAALDYLPDLILMDIAMPEMDGLAAVRELRQYTEMDHTPILALTASTDPDDLENAYQSGYNDVVDKSFNRDVLLHTINAWLSG
jgi:two-component system, cell cycle response regulator DivK